VGGQIAVTGAGRRRTGGGCALKTLDFLAQLRDRDIQVWADGDQLRCNAPAGTLTPELRHELQQRKPDILTFLRSARTFAEQARAIVPLQSRGTSVPVFAVAGHNGDVFCFRSLAQRLGDGQPFFGLQPPGLDGHLEPLARVEDLAAYFAAQIHAFHPAGPYVVAGYCAGGTIAFELARQLLRDGATVNALILFGSPFSTWYRRGPQLRHRFGQQVERVVRHTRALATLPFAERRAYIAERLRNREAERRAERPSANDPVQVWRAKVERATFTALRRYSPGHFAGRLVLILPSKARSCSGDAATQWHAVAKSTEKYFGPDGCDGAVMLREPHAPAFAELFRQCLAANLDRELGLPLPKHG
jgi:thioesterase domain-containing protein